MSEVIAAVGGDPNFVVITPWGTILVSDDERDDGILRETIREVTFDGDVSVWVEGVPAPNGMVFSLDGETLYVAATFGPDSGLWRVPVLEDGSADKPEKWTDLGGGFTPDGVAIDSEDNVYVALNVTGEIAKVAPDGSFVILARGAAWAASLAFGRGELDPCSIYATSLFDTQLWRIGTGIPGP
jgi:gluconolactonase